MSDELLSETVYCVSCGKTHGLKRNECEAASAYDLLQLHKYGGLRMRLLAALGETLIHLGIDPDSELDLEVDGGGRTITAVMRFK